MKWAGAGWADRSCLNQRAFSDAIMSMSFDLAAGSLPAVGASCSTSSLAGTAGGSGRALSASPLPRPPPHPAAAEAATREKNREAPALRNVIGHKG
jgi:hypothetical protein